MWHLKAVEKGSASDVVYSFLFHTLNDVSAFVLKANAFYDYQLTFIPIYEKPPAADTVANLETVAETPFKFPEPMSSSAE